MATQDEKIKWVEGSPFMVDGFRFTNPRCKHYFLTHFHSGLSKSFSAGKIYTSQGTANLVIELLGVNAERVVALPMNSPVIVAGFEITLVDANHCPAAVMFVIRDPRPRGRTTLHTGDFRADRSVCTNPVVTALKGRVDSLYLDTTYCGPRHAFPDQNEVLAQAASLVRIERQREPNTLFLVGTYSIGKERVLEAVAKAAGSRCLVTSRKARMMRLSGAWSDSAYTTHDASTGGGIDGVLYASVRAVPLQDTNSPTTLLGVLAEARASGAPFTNVVGVRPTGWTHTNARKGGSGGAGRAAGKGAGAGGSFVGGLGNTNRGLLLPSLSRGELSGIAGAAGLVAPGVTARGPCGTGGVGTSDSGGGERLSSCSGADSLVDKGKEAESAEWEDEDDEAAAWGAGKGGGGDGDGELGVMDGDEPPQTARGPWSGKKPWVEGNARVYSLPYSEHSSYTQLKDFVRAVRPTTIIPTVNASSGASVEKMLNHFLEFMDLSKDRKRLDSYFCKRPSLPGGDGVEGHFRSTGIAPSTSSRKRPKNTSSTSSDLVGKGSKQNNLNKKAAQQNRQSLSPAPFLGCESARGSSGGEPALCRRRGMVVANPYVDAGDRHVAPPPSPRVAPTERSPLPPPCAADAGGSGGGETNASALVLEDSIEPDPSAVELDLIDVEAQKAIMADIERRKQKFQQQQQQQQEEEKAETPPRLADSQPKGFQSENSSATKWRNSTPARRGGETAKVAVAPAGSGGKRMRGAERGGARYVGGPNTTRGNSKPREVSDKSGVTDITDSAQKTIDECDGERVLVLETKTKSLPLPLPPSPMNIRDFFPRSRGL